MKILNLVIRNPKSEKIRELDFEENGLSVIYGKVNKPENEKETSNSIGKTLLLKFIDYIFGANESSEVVKPIIHGWYLEATVKHKNNIVNVKRILGNSEIEINGGKYSLGEYREFFNIERKLYNKQIFLSQKNHLISGRSEASMDDYTSMFNLLKLESLSTELIEYYAVQDKIKELKNLEKRFIELFNEVKISEVEQKIFLLNKTIVEKENELKSLDERISNIQIGHEKTEMMNDYAEKNYTLKLLQAEYQKLNIEFKRLEKSYKQFKNLDISSEELQKLYEKASFEVPELIIKRFEEVQKFHENVYSDRKKLTEERIEEIEQKKVLLKERIDTLNSEMNNIANVISQNEIYQESMAIYKEKNMELQQLKYEQGELSRFEGLINERKNEEDSLAIKYNDIKNVYNDNQKKIDNYRDFIYDMIPNLYTEDVNAYFSINLKNRHKRNRPFAIELNLTGDTGEGVGEVRKILIDFLLFKFNILLDILLQDSSCFSGIDNRQVSNLIRLGNSVAVETNKQYIISINDYQLNKNDKATMEIISSKTKLELDENDKLLGFTF
ncbi:DUF2326 domain-containing protein [Lysinibacillus parviboronicapiens]|uniref:DUF2326 domain-containing protein n=1 Tax=Lysinibacillus parviboronicapiens TaxID=436516 RepID=UPI000D3C9052|nr:DUF2326 domain-containing protein [Lysinibacillus parviboronicapiens]